MGSIIPFFRDRGFDTDATEKLVKAYDIACRSLHPRGRIPTMQDFLAKKIIEAALHGEFNPDRLAAIALSKLSTFHRDVTARFGLVPNFFVSAPDAPEIVEKLWDFAKSAYLDNPIPSLFKERLFVSLSRFCAVRYCVVRHCGFLVGYGNAAGNAAAPPQTIDQVLKLLKATPPWQRQLEPIYEVLAQLNAPIEWPDAETELEDAVFALCTLIFVEPATSARAQQTLTRVLGGRRMEYLLALLAFIRTAHYWTVVHPGLEIEDDVRALMSENKELASLLLRDPEGPSQRQPAG